MKLSKRELQAALYALAKANTRVHELRAKISDHCQEVYGVDPSDVDNDQFIDCCDGGMGRCSGMTVEEFEQSMEDCINR